MEQQVKDYLQNSKQINQNLNRMTSALDTQEVATSESPEISQVITNVIEKTLPKQTQVEDKSLKKTDIYSSVPTIDLTNSEEEEGRSSPVPISIETGNDFQDLTNGRNGNVLSPLPQS